MTMAIISSVPFHCRNSLFCLLCLTSLLFILSWFLILRSENQPSVISSPTSRNKPASLNTDMRCANQPNIKKQTLKVFMYDMPPEFHFGLLNWKPNGSSVWPDIRKEVPHYPSGLKSQHSVDYWLTLDLLYSEYVTPSPSRVAVRVHNSSDADVIFVPFFSSLSCNVLSRLGKEERIREEKIVQEKLVKYLEGQEEWKRSGGVDHIILAHHPISLVYARNRLWPAVYILSDFGRYSPSIANVVKDVIAPYKHVIKPYVNDTSSFDSRPILMYFQGAISRKDGGSIRKQLHNLLKDENDVHFAYGTVQRGGINNATRGMHSSKFCLNIAGDTPSSNRLFDAIVSHCVPVIISDEIELPFENIIDYSEFCIFVPTADAVNGKFLINLVRGITREKWTEMWMKLQQVDKSFEFRHPSKDDDAVQMIWRSIADKVPAIKLKRHRSRRYSRTMDDRAKNEPPAFVVPHEFW